MMERCPYCFKPLPDGGECECHYEDSPNARIEEALRPGTIVGACYQIGAVLGQGGFGITYRGYDLDMQKVVAIKEFYPQGMVVRYGSFTSEPVSGGRSNYVRSMNTEGKNVFRKSLDLFYREAVALGRLDKQPNVVHAYRIFRENGTAYIVMEFVEGQSLKAMIRERGRIPEEELLPLLEPVLTALDKVHQEGILHRDIAPDNIMIENGEPVLLDFGASRVEEGHHSSLVIGKKGFSSPEQVAGEKQDRRSDIYAIGATYYTALSGTIPQDAVMRGIKDKVIPLKEFGAQISEKTSDAVAKAMAVDPDARWDTAAEFRDALRADTGREINEKEHTYQNALRLMSTGTLEGYGGAQILFEQVSGYKDSDRLAGECARKAAEHRERSSKDEKTAPDHRKDPDFRDNGGTRSKKNKKLPVLLATAAVMALALFFMLRPGKEPEKPGAAIPSGPSGQEMTLTALAAYSETSTAIVMQTETQQVIDVKLTAIAADLARNTAIAHENETKQAEPTASPVPPTDTPAPASTNSPEPTAAKRSTPKVTANENQVPLGTPEITNAESLGNGQIRLTWEEVAGADTYEVYYSRGNGVVNYRKLAKTTDKDLTVESPISTGTILLRLRACSNTQCGDYSARRSLAITDEAAPVPPADTPAQGASDAKILNQMGEDAYWNGDYAEALEYLIPAAEAGDPDAQYRLGYMYGYGQGVQQSDETALKYYQMAADQGHARAQSKITILSQKISITAEPTIMPNPASDPQALTQMGRAAYRIGNYAKALEYLIPAAEAGDPDAQYRLGHMYESGQGVEQSYEMAVKYYQMAADQGYTAAISGLNILSKKLSISPESAAADPDVKAQMGEDAYWDGNYAKAIGYLVPAAEAGNPEAQLRLGYMYENGSGVQQSYKKALQYYQMAADQGVEYAVKKVSELSIKLTPTAEPTAAQVSVLPQIPKKTDVSAGIQAGNIITFGSYEQDKKSGPDPIEWQVLAVEDGRALLLSKYGLESKHYNDTNTNVTWETCSLRKWLNEDFFDSTFTSAEKAKIREVLNSNPDNPTYGTKGGNDTRDKVFLLSISDVEKYMQESSSRKCKATFHADDAEGDVWWWLRSPGTNRNDAAYVGTFGDIHSGGNLVYTFYKIGIVRPALWLDL